MAQSDNPFERYDLDPRDGITTITQRLKELAEDARDDAERERIRAAWEELTLHPTRRLLAALFAHPETRAPLGSPPSLTRRRSPSADPSDTQPTLRELAARPRLAATLVEAPADDDVPSLADDPILRGHP